MARLYRYASWPYFTFTEIAKRIQYLENHTKVHGLLDKCQNQVQSIISMGTLVREIRQESKGTFCTAPNGATIPEGAKIQIPDKCEQCSCYKSSSPGDTDLMLSCCGYGKHGGVFMPPEGCKTVVGDDGCSIKLVQIADETLPC